MRKSHTHSIVLTDRLDSIDHLTTVVVPPLKTLETQVHEDEQCNLEHDLPQDSLPAPIPDRLVEIMDKLRSPEGCPWDRARSRQSVAQSG